MIKFQIVRLNICSEFISVIKKIKFIISLIGRCLYAYLCSSMPCFETYVSLKLIQTYTFLYRCNHIHSYAYGHVCAVMHAYIYTLLCKRSFLYVVMLPYFMRVYTKLCVRLSYTILCIRCYASFLKSHLCTVILPYAKNHLLKNYP